MIIVNKLIIISIKTITNSLIIKNINLRIINISIIISLNILKSILTSINQMREH